MSDQRRMEKGQAIMDVLAATKLETAFLVFADALGTFAGGLAAHNGKRPSDAEEMIDTIAAAAKEHVRTHWGTIKTHDVGGLS